MIVYGSSLSPYVRKTLVFAAEKGLEVELQRAGMGAGPPEFKLASPFGKMPGFRDGDFMISDSTAIITYLDAIKPEPNLIPLEPRARSRTIWFEEFADTILMACLGKIFFNRVVAPRFLGRDGDLGAAEHAEKVELPPLVDYLESVLGSTGHLVEDRLTLADLAVASPFINLLHLEWSPNADGHPKTAGFLREIHARPSFQAWIDQERAFLAR